MSNRTLTQVSERAGEWLAGPPQLRPVKIKVCPTLNGESWTLEGSIWKQPSDELPDYLRRAASCAACADGFREFMEAKCDGKKWAVEIGGEITLSRDLYYEWSVEFGLSILRKIFGGELVVIAAGGAS